MISSHFLLAIHKRFIFLEKQNQHQRLLSSLFSIRSSETNKINYEHWRSFSRAIRTLKWRKFYLQFSSSREYFLVHDINLDLI